MYYYYTTTNRHITKTTNYNYVHDLRGETVLNCKVQEK